MVFDLAPLAYLNFDANGRLLDFNGRPPPSCSTTDRKADVRRPLADFFSPRHHRRLSRHIEQCGGAGKPLVTRLELRAHGSSAPGLVEMNTRPAADGLVYRTLLLPLSGASPVPGPADDARFRALVENSSEVVCIGAPDGTIFYTTPSVKRVLGYEPASWFGRNAFEIMRPQQADESRAALRQLAAAPTGAVVRLVTEVRHADGSWRWVEGILTNLIGQPAVGGIVCNYRDITDARHAEEALRASEQRYRLLAESLPQMVSIRDSAGHIEYCNSHWREYRGIDCSGSIIHDWQSGIPPEDAASLRRPPVEDGVPNPWEGECRIRRASDGALPMAFRPRRSPSKTGGIPRQMARHWK